MIDYHVHIGKIFYGRNPLTPKKLIETMNKYGIEKSIILPIENPEETHFYLTTDYVLKICKKYREKLIPFCNVDPRRGKNNEKEERIEKIIEEYVKKGAKGFGEVLANLQFNDKRMKNIYRACGDLKLSIVFHLGGVPGNSTIGLTDEIGLPYIEEVLNEFPDTIFVAHGPGWWAEISGDVTAEERNSYPKGKIKKEGKVQYLLHNYPNMYADLSAGSGYNALTRDIEYGIEFLNKFYNKLLFATDYLYPEQELPIIDYLKNLNITEEKKKKIFYENAKKLLNI
ncbi:MAG TPA: amidohydrolase family protein [bacterium]|nr:amidohydrolase family protein [bacterium]HOM27800.1 amidohydrolase family protein [bacterium]